MTTATTQHQESTAGATDRLLMAIELGRRQWKVGFTTQQGQRIRRRTLSADAWDRLPEEVAAAKKRLDLPVDAPVTSCYEAGRDGFWIHRYLVGAGVDNLVVDSSSIEVNRRARRAKTDAIDLTKLLSMLRRHVGGENKVWRVVHIPSTQDEERRQPHRELWGLKRDRTRVTNRITGLLATVGVYVTVDAKLLQRLDRLMQWNGKPIPGTLRARVAREWEKVALFTTQIQALERARRLELREKADASVALVRQLLQLRGIGNQTAWLFVTELFAWRQFRNRREVGGITGMVGTPYRSGLLNHEQGISKAGNKRVRSMAIQIAWGWLIHQPRSALTQWYTERFARGGPVARKIGIVAVARRLVIDLWRYLDAGVIPEGAVFKHDALATNGGTGK
jgi:transposase